MQFPHISEIIWYLSFCVWLISLSVMFSRSIHIVNMPKFHILIYSNSSPLYVYPFLHCSVDRHLGCIHLLASVNNAAVDMGVQLSPPVPAFNSLGCIPRSGIPGSHGNSIFLRNQQAVFHGIWIILHSQPPKHKGSNFSTSFPTRVIFHSVNCKCETSIFHFDVDSSND